MYIYIYILHQKIRQNMLLSDSAINIYIYIYIYIKVYYTKKRQNDGGFLGLNHTVMS